MHFLDLTLPTPAENLALDEALLLAAEADGQIEYLRVWEHSQYFIVLGKNCGVYDDVWLDRCEAEGVPVLRRSSGGGTILQGPGCLNFAVVLRYDRAPGLSSVPVSIVYVLDRVREALAEFEPHVARAGTSDLAIGQLKFCGSAQRRQRTHFLHHGSILLHFDLAAITRYLKEPRRQPPYRAGRDHASFLANLPADARQIRYALQTVWGASIAARSWPADLVSEVARRYSERSWVYRR